LHFFLSYIISRVSVTSIAIAWMKGQAERVAQWLLLLLHVASITCESHSDYTWLTLRQRTPRKGESDSCSVSSAVESLGPSNEHFDQHEQGRTRA